MTPPRTPPRREGERQPRNRTAWSFEEDEVIRRYVAEHGEHDWRSVEDLLNRSKGNCRYRWMEFLRSTVTENPLTDEEKARIRQLYHIYGANWDAIRKATKGDNRFPVRRTPFDMKNYMEQVLLERAQDQHDGNLQARGEDIDRNNEEGSSHGNQSLDLALSLRVSPSMAGNIDLNAPAPSDAAPD